MLASNNLSFKLLLLFAFFPVIFFFYFNRKYFFFSHLTCCSIFLYYISIFFLVFFSKPSAMTNQFFHLFQLLTEFGDELLPTTFKTLNRARPCLLFSFFLVSTILSHISCFLKIGTFFSTAE